MKINRVVIVAIFVMLFIVMVLQAGIYWNTKPQEEYELITVTGTVNVTALEEVDLIDEGYIEVTEGNYIRPPEIEKSKIIFYIDTIDYALEESDNFTIDVSDDFWEWWYDEPPIRGREE